MSLSWRDETSPVANTTVMEDAPFATPSFLKPNRYRMNLAKSLNDQRINRNGSKHVSRNGVRMSSGFPEMDSRAPIVIYGCLIAREKCIIFFNNESWILKKKRRTNSSYLALSQHNK
jgi:hypothetical protein